MDSARGHPEARPVQSLPPPVRSAIKSGAQTIVTNNLRGFPPPVLARWNIEARTPDDFIIDHLDLDAGTVRSALQRIADSWRNPAGRVEDVLASLEREGLLQSVARLRC